MMGDHSTGGVIARMVEVVKDRRRPHWIKPVGLKQGNMVTQEANAMSSNVAQVSQASADGGPQ